MLDQIMKTAAMQSTRNYQLLDAISTNMGNVNTFGYKSKRFDMFFRPDGNVGLVNRVDHSAGNRMITRRELDVSIDGSGYVMVTRTDGSTAYTRNGSFAKDAKGFLVSAFGDLVGTGIQLPANYEKLRINKNGVVELMEKRGEGFKAIGKIPLVDFPNPEGLENIGHNLYKETSDSGVPSKIEAHEKIYQGTLETSNVNIHDAVADVLRMNAGVIANIRIVKVIDEIYREAVNLRQ